MHMLLYNKFRVGQTLLDHLHLMPQCVSGPMATQSQRKGRAGGSTKGFSVDFVIDSNTCAKSIAVSVGCKSSVGRA